MGLGIEGNTFYQLNTDEETTISERCTDPTWFNAREHGQQVPLFLSLWYKTKGRQVP